MAPPCSNGTCYDEGCGYGNSGNCDGCGLACSDNCGTNCSGCSSCAGKSGGSDGGGCTCSGNCTEGCKDQCGSGCNETCTSVEAVDLYNTLLAGLNKKILAADLNNINQMIVLEATRRSKTNISSQSFTSKEKATSAKIQTLQSNLEKIGEKYKTTQNANPKVKAWKSVGEELIEKVTNAYLEKITSKSSKD